MLILKQILAKHLAKKRVRQAIAILGVGLLLISSFSIISPDPFTRLGYPGIFLFNMFGGSGIFLFPSLSRYLNVILLSFVTALGMAVNDSLAWIIGSSGTAVIPRSSSLGHLERGLKKYGLFGIFFWSLMPFPYDLVGLIAGYLGIKYVPYIIPTFSGKFIRFLLIGWGIISVVG